MGGHVPAGYSDLKIPVRPDDPVHNRDKYARITYERPDGRLVGAQPTTEGQGQAVCGTAGREDVPGLVEKS